MPQEVVVRQGVSRSYWNICDAERLGLVKSKVVEVQVGAAFCVSFRVSDAVCSRAESC